MINLQEHYNNFVNDFLKYINDMIDLNNIFDQNKTIAVYGMSKNPGKAAFSVPAFMMKQGYKIIPVNPTVDSILNMKCYSNLLEIEDKIDILNIFRPSDELPDIITEAVKRHEVKGDINLIWVQEGLFNESAKQIAENAGIDYIENRCIYKDYVNRD